MNIEETLKTYLALYPEESNRFSLLRTQIAAGEQLATRKNFTGHAAGGGLVLSGDRSKVLLIHHTSLERWLQPGGHMEPEESSPLEAARREVCEETGLKDSALQTLSAVPVHIDTHFIPANPKKQEPEHWHHEFRYAFIVTDELLHVDDDGVTAAEWVTLDDPRVQSQPWIVQAIRRLG